MWDAKTMTVTRELAPSGGEPLLHLSGSWQFGTQLSFPGLLCVSTMGSWEHSRWVQILVAEVEPSSQTVKGQGKREAPDS